MSDAPSAEPLQFDRAEPIAGGMPCASCKRPLEGEYWTLNQLRLCADCAPKVTASLGLRAGAWPRAVLFGLGAAAAGAVLWFGIEYFLHLRLGLVAIAIGWMVGKAIRKATGAGAGPEFQVLAIALTYLSVASSNLIMVAAVSGGEIGGLLDPGVLMHLLTLPVTGGSPMGIIILGIALYEAWRFSKGVAVRVAGPFRLAPTPSAALAPHV
jgi:hypothetical protein